MSEAQPPPVGGHDAALAEALEHANLPALVPALHQLTGDERWLHDLYRPTRSRGMDDNDPGGFTDEIAAGIRAAVLDAVAAHDAGTPAAVPAPTGELLHRLLELAVGEPVPEDYVPMAAEDLGFVPAPTPEAPGSHVDAVVIGAGVCGILTAIKLAEAGVEHVVLEKNDDVGGGWLENVYPGAGVDTPSHLYSYSFAPRRWSTHFGKRDEVEQYLRDVATEHDVYDAIRFGTEVTAADWDETTATWSVRTEQGDRFTARVLISATGVLNRPKIPSIPGLDDFRGEVFHTARWPEDLDLTGKHVAVVGSGASAMQTVPAIAERVASLTVFQRSRQWIAPNDAYFRAMGEQVHRVMDRVPFYRAWYRTRLAWNFNDRVHASLQVDPDWEYPERSVNATNDAHRRVFTRYVESELAGRPDLIEKSLPDYPPFGKRMLLDNGWFRTLRRDDVRLVTEGVEAVTPTGLRGDGGTEVDVDVIVLATGFQAQRYLWPIEVTGRDGRTLADAWGPDEAHAYLGMTVPGFPNLFIAFGPGTGLGHGGSMITIAECQLRYITELLATMARRDLAAVEVLPEVEQEYWRRHDEAHDRMLWTHPGMTNWYRNDAGRVVVTMPWRIVDYWRMTHDVDLDDYRTRSLATTTTRGSGGSAPSVATSADRRSRTAR